MKESIRIGNMSRYQALQSGMTIDDTCNPPVAYEGARFNPDQWCCVPTEREENLMAQLDLVEHKLRRLFQDVNNWTGGTPDNEKSECFKYLLLVSGRLDPILQKLKRDKT